MLGGDEVTSEMQFRTPEEEVRKLLDECSELRRTLKTISSQLSRIETRVKAAFPAVAKSVKERQLANASQKESSLTSEEALSEFDNIVRLASSGATSDAEAHIAHKSGADLLVIAREVGVAFPSNKPSIRAMRDAILGKVRESLLLSRHNRRE